MKGIKLVAACLVIGIINIITLGSYKYSPTLEMSMAPKEVDYLGLEELHQKLDSVNSNLNLLQHEEITDIPNSSITNK